MAWIAELKKICELKDRQLYFQKWIELFPLNDCRKYSLMNMCILHMYSLVEYNIHIVSIKLDFKVD